MILLHTALLGFILPPVFYQYNKGEILAAF